MAFRTAHGIDDGSYKDLYIGDQINIEDGTYNGMWVVAHFDYYRNKKAGNSYATKGVVLITYGALTSSKMFNTRSTAGGYYASIMHNTTCPAIALALGTVFGSYLLNFGIHATSMVDDNILSNAGAGMMGATNDGAWVSTQCTLPTEIQVYGTKVFSSSHYDVGEADCKLALFNFILHTGWSKGDMMLRDIASSFRVAAAGYFGVPVAINADDTCGFRPLIYIG